MNRIFSNNLKRFRQQKSLTQEQVAEALGVNAHTVSRWECGTTLPDVTLLPELARLYCVTVDDFFKENRSAYENYARRLASVFDMTREPEDFIRADQEFRRLIISGQATLEDFRIYGILHQFMAKASAKKAESLFDRVLSHGEVDSVTLQRTRHQKMLLLVQQGRGHEAVDAAHQWLAYDETAADNWICVVAAYQYCDRFAEAYEWFQKAAERFPDRLNLYIFGGDICSRLGKKQEALEYWDRALLSDSYFYDATYSKVFFYEAEGNYQSAYALRIRIAERLRKDGYDVEAAAEEQKAEACLHKERTKE